MCRREDIQMRSFGIATATVLVCSAFGIGALAQGLPIGDPDQEGISRERLQRVMAIVGSEVTAGRIAGAVFGLERHGKVVWLQATGFRDKPGNLPMTTDAIFPLASVAAMELVEQGRIALRDPLSKYLPAFKAVHVAKELQGGAPGTPGPIATVDPIRPITIQDLLRHTAGLVNGGAFSRTPVRVAYVEVLSRLAPSRHRVVVARDQLLELRRAGG
jgi:CubicO group peptidase (beta-lactamase class C family)